MKKKERKGQISIEYLMIVGFVTFVVIGILGIAFFYSGAIKDKIKETQINNYANKIISTSESVFFAGEPSKATISAYLPDNVRQIEISGNELTINFSSSSGTNIVEFTSEVQLSGGPLNINQGLKRIEIVAESNQVVINQLN